MELIHPASFASAVAAAWDDLEQIAEIVGRRCGKTSAQEFLTACKQLDCTRANQLLDQTVEALSGYSSVSTALVMFAEKFPELNPGLSGNVSRAKTERDKVKALNSYLEDIKRLNREKHLEKKRR